MHDTVIGVQCETSNNSVCFDIQSKTPAHQTLANMAVHAVTITELPYANARENGQDHCAKVEKNYLSEIKSQFSNQFINSLTNSK